MKDLIKEELESLKKNTTECTAAFLRLKEVVRANHEFRLRSDPSTSGDFSKGFYKGSGAYVMNEAALALNLDDTCLNELIVERTKGLTAQLDQLAVDYNTLVEKLASQLSNSPHSATNSHLGSSKRSPSSTRSTCRKSGKYSVSASGSPLDRTSFLRSRNSLLNLKTGGEKPTTRLARTWKIARHSAGQSSVFVLARRS